MRLEWNKTPEHDVAVQGGSIKSLKSDPDDTDHTGLVLNRFIAGHSDCLCRLKL